MKRGRPTHQYRLSLDGLKGMINSEVDIIIGLYNRYLISHSEAKRLIDRTLVDINDRDQGYTSMSY
jgi:hypothetical protein